MKKTYKKPNIEVEIYSLSESIASNCDIVVNNGPAVGNHEQCTNYKDPYEGDFVSLFSIVPATNTNFYEDTNCDCYTTGNNSAYWTS